MSQVVSMLKKVEMKIELLGNLTLTDLVHRKGVITLVNGFLIFLNKMPWWH